MPIPKYITDIMFQGEKYCGEVLKVYRDVWVAKVSVRYKGIFNPIEITQKGNSQEDAINKLRKFLSD